MLTYTRWIWLSLNFYIHCHLSSSDANARVSTNHQERLEIQPAHSKSELTSLSMTSIFRTTSLRSAAGEQYPAERRAPIHQPFRDSNFRPVPWSDVFLFINFHLRATRHFNEWPGVRLAVLLVKKQSWGIMVLDGLFSIYSLAGYHRRSQCLTHALYLPW